MRKAIKLPRRMSKENIKYNNKLGEKKVQNKARHKVVDAVLSNRQLINKSRMRQ